MLLLLLLLVQMREKQLGLACRTQHRLIDQAAVAAGEIARLLAVAVVLVALFGRVRVGVGLLGVVVVQRLGDLCVLDVVLDGLWRGW